MIELKKGFYLVTADGINTMLRWDGEDWVDMRGIRPCFKEVVQTRYCGENNPVFEQDEPIAFVTGVFGGRFVVEPTNPAMVLPVNIALYTHPQPRTWVGLTDEEVNQLYTQIQEQVDKHWTDGGTSMMFPTTLYKAIEAKLKEKNNG